MGRRGPKPTPTAIKLARGNPGKRAVNKREPTAISGRLTCPAWLDATAKALWRRLVPQLEAMGVLAATDANALARYCAIWSRWRTTEAYVRKHGPTYEVCDDKGAVKYIAQRPEVAIANKLATELRQLEAVFGLTPSARSSLKAEAPASDPLEDLLKRQPA